VELLSNMVASAGEEDNLSQGGNWVRKHMRNESFAERLLFIVMYNQDPPASALFGTLAASSFLVCC